MSVSRLNPMGRHGGRALRPQPGLASLVGLSLVLGALTACSDDAIQGETDPVVCANDDDCLAGSVCLLGVCTAAIEGQLSTVDLEVRPPDRSGLPTQQLLGFDITLDDRILVRLADVAPVGGVVCTHGTLDTCTDDPEDELTPSPVPGEVVALPEVSIPGRRLAVQTTTGPQASYALTLVERSPYSIRVFPEDPQLGPVFVPTPWTSGVAGQQGTPRPIVLPPEEERIFLSGSITAGDGVGAGPVPSVRVMVEDSGRQLSSVGFTDELGMFVIQMNEAPPLTAQLVVTPTEVNPGYPRVEVTGVELGASADLGELNLGEVFAPVPFSGTILGNDGSPVAGASVYLAGAVGVGEVRRLLSTDEAGLFDADLPPGLYDVVAVAPVGDPAAGMAMTGEAVEIAPGAPPLELMLQARVELAGVVFRSDGEPVADAQLSFRRLGPPGGMPERVLGGATWRFTTTAGTDGSWALPLDAGRYRVECTPPAGSGAPAWTLVYDVFSSPEPLTIDLPPPAVFAGQVLRAETGEPVGAGAEVRVFAPIVSERGEAIALGTTITDDEGNFGLVLPDLFSTPDEPGPDGGPEQTDGGS